MSRVMGIDFGLKRVGIALSDPAGKVALPYTTLEEESEEILFNQIVSIVREKNVKLIVLGLPIHLSGDESEMSKLVREAGRELERELKVEVVFWDERLTSKEARHILVNARRTFRKKGVYKGKKSRIDKIAATLILQGYLDLIRKDDFHDEI